MIPSIFDILISSHLRMNSYIFPSLQQVRQTYDVHFRPSLSIHQFSAPDLVPLSEKSYIKGSKPDDINETAEDSTEMLMNEKQLDRSEGFEDFSYDLNDFEFNMNQSEYQPKLEQPATENEVKRLKTKSKQRQRKIRTTITKDRLEEMNRIFKDYLEQKDKGKNSATSLKQIGQKLQLGYSTILHKYREFRQNKIVKGGALLQSLQKKRKYKKSREVQRYIQLSLRERPFYTAVQLSKYIRRRFHKYHSRSIISRHLTQMGYSFNNIKPYPIQKNSAKHIQARRLFANIIQAYADDDANYVFIDEVAFSKNLFSRYFTNFIASAQDKKSNQKQSDYVSLILASSNEKILFFEIKNGFLKRQDFRNAVKITGNLLGHDKRYSLQPAKEHILLTDIHRIHFDDQTSINSRQDSIIQGLAESRMRRFFLPPGSPGLNPLESLFGTIRERLSKEKILDQDTLRQKLQQIMKVVARESTNVYFKEFKQWMQKAKHGQSF